MIKVGRCIVARGLANTWPTRPGSVKKRFVILRPSGHNPPPNRD
jgi:hypothetical protein